MSQAGGQGTGSKVSRRKFVTIAGGVVVVAAAGAAAYVLTAPSPNTTVTSSSRTPSATSSLTTLSPNTTVSSTTSPATSSLSPSLAQAASKYLSAAQTEGKVVVYNTSEETNLLKVFAGLFPKVNVQNVLGGVNVVVQKVQQEGQAGIRNNDVFEGIYDSSAMVIAPYSANYEPNQIPSWLQSWNSLQTSLKFTVPSWIVNFGFAYNSSLVPQDQVPKSIYDLLDPKWTSKIVWRTPWIAASADFHMIAWDAYFGRDFTKWQNYFQQLHKVANASFIADYSQFNTAIGTGQYAIGMADPDSAVPGFTPSYPNIRFGAFKEGLGYQPGGFSLNKTASDPNAGKLLIEFSVADEGQKALSDGGVTPMNPSFSAPSHVTNALKLAGGQQLPDYIPRWLQILTYFDPDPVKSAQIWTQRIQQIYTS